MLWCIVFERDLHHSVCTTSINCNRSCPAQAMTEKTLHRDVPLSCWTRWCISSQRMHTVEGTKAQWWRRGGCTMKSPESAAVSWCIARFYTFHWFTIKCRIQPNTRCNQIHNTNTTKSKHWSSICSQLCISPWFGQSALHRSALTANACVWHTMECILHLLQCNTPFGLPMPIAAILEVYLYILWLATTTWATSISSTWLPRCDSCTLHKAKKSTI